MDPLASSRSTERTLSSVRLALLDFAGEFVRKARRQAGVERIALLGSILTAKQGPKDIDILVTVSDACGLEPLAALARRLKGRAQSLNHGADVFLGAIDGQYLGRICHWRDCRPGVRSSCDAEHCGARPYVHDDLLTVTLPQELMREPPLELYPAIVARTELPSDVWAWMTGLHEPAT